jgi:hypothetical protein
MRKLARPELVDRRVVILYRIAEAVAAQILPATAQPRQVADRTLAGIAFRRRRVVGSRFVPARLHTSHCATHFVLVHSGTIGDPSGGVYIARRDTAPRWQAWISGPGSGHPARFRVIDRQDSLELAGDSDDRSMHLLFKARVSRGVPDGSVFRSLPQAADTLTESLISLGLTSPDGVTGESPSVWRRVQLQPLQVECLESSFFDAWQQAGAGLVEFDSAFALREDQFAWSQAGTLCCDMVPA